MAHEPTKIWGAGKWIREGEYISLARPKSSSTPLAPAATIDGYARAEVPSPLISQGERPPNPLIAGTPPQKIRNS